MENRYDPVIINGLPPFGNLTAAGGACVHFLSQGLTAFLT